MKKTCREFVFVVVGFLLFAALAVTAVNAAGSGDATFRYFVEFVKKFDRKYETYEEVWNANLQHRWKKSWW